MHYALKGSGKLSLSGKDAKSVDQTWELEVTPSRIIEFAARMRAEGFSNYKASVFYAFSAAGYSDEALDVALEVFSGGKIALVDEVMHLNRGRLRSWSEGVAKVLFDWLGTDQYQDQSDAQQRRGFVVTDSEARLTLENGSQVKLRYTVKIARRVGRHLRASGIDLPPLKVFSGPIDLTALQGILFFGTEDSKALDLKENEIDGFVTQNRRMLYGWWLVLQDLIQRYYQEGRKAPLAPPEPAGPSKDEQATKSG